MCRSPVPADSPQVSAGYLRDRDFDFDPPRQLTRPTVDSEASGIPFGWRWCRHQIENYLIDPSVTTEATGWPLAEVEAALRSAADRILFYQAVRWTIGNIRRSLPPHYELGTRPAGQGELVLQTGLDSASVAPWMFSSIETFRAPMVAQTDTSAVRSSFDKYCALFDVEFVGDLVKVLLWFSGKDMLAGMSEWLLTKNVASPGEFRRILRDWIIANPERTLDLLAEWKGMTQVLRA